MPFLINQDELDAYYLADPAHPRAAGILWPLIIEKRIDSMFELALRPDDKVKSELFRPTGALGSYGAKVQLAYLLGWVGKDIYDDLITISKIRNRFAHYIEVKDFTDQRIAQWLANLKGSVLLPDMIKSAKIAAEKETEEQKSRPRDEPQMPGKMKVSKKGYLFILEGMAEDPQLKFRWCIDLMVHKLDEFAANMKKNLEGLPGSWLVGEDKPEQLRQPQPSGRKP